MMCLRIVNLCGKRILFFGRGGWIKAEELEVRSMIAEFGRWFEGETTIEGCGKRA
jgi:hypothetical protein